MPGPVSDLNLLRFIFKVHLSKMKLMCSCIDTEWLTTKYLLFMFFVNQYETQILIYS